MVQDKIGSSIVEELDHFFEQSKIAHRKQSAGCIFCGNTDNTVAVKGKTVCSNCYEELRNIK